jgi:hypothetical protein
MRNLSSIEETKEMIVDLEIPSLFSIEMSHSTPVPQSVTFNTGTLAPTMGVTPLTCPCSSNVKMR